MAAETWTVGRLLTWTTDYLKKQGADTPRLDAEVLLAEARHCQRIELYTAFAEEAPEEVRVAFRELVRRRAEGTPVAYLVGRREFYSLSFRVTPDVLIPRPETELLVITLLDLIKALPGDQPLWAADVGTGSGCISIAAAKHAGRLRVCAIDKSPEALAIAKANAEKHKVSDRVEFSQGDLLAGLPAERKLDFVVSNPPYISSAEYAELAVDVRNHEPRLALEAGPRGTEVIERLIPQAAERLNPGGRLLMEISPMIAAATEQLLDAEPRLERGATIKDLAGHARVVQARRK